MNRQHGRQSTCKAGKLLTQEKKYSGLVVSIRKIPGYNLGLEMGYPAVFSWYYCLSRNLLGYYLKLSYNRFFRLLSTKIQQHTM